MKNTMMRNEEKKILRSNFLQELRERESYCFLCFVHRDKR